VLGGGYGADRFPVGDSLDQFQSGGRANLRTDAYVGVAQPQPVTRSMFGGGGGVSGSGPGGGGGGGGGGSGSVEARLYAAEQDLRALKQQVVSTQAVQRQVSNVEDLRRTISGVADATNKRMQQAEDAIVAGGERMRALNTVLEQNQQKQVQLEAHISLVLEERRREMQTELRTSMQDVEGRLSDRTAQVMASLDKQTQHSHEERQRIEAASKQLTAQVLTESNGRIREIQAQTIPTMERSLLDAMGELRKSVEATATAMSTDVRAVSEAGARADAKVRKEMKDGHAAMQKGLLALRADSEKQGKTLAAIIKEVRPLLRYI
jgi:hypothetical protein